MRHEPGPPPALEKRRQPGRLRAIVLAVLVHVAFFALIVFGITWQNPPSAPVQAELWDKLPSTPAATPPAPKPQPKPAPQPQPKPAPQPQPPKPPEPKPEEVKPPPQPDAAAIAQKLEREKAQQQAREKAEQEKRERLEKQKAEDARKRREQEEAAKKKREEEKRRQDEERAKAEAAEQARVAAAAAAAARQAEIDSFVNRIKDKIRGRANIPDTVTGKPEVQVRIRVLPGGEVLDITIVKSSGNRVYDTAIERAIRSAQPLPVPPANSELFPQFRDLILNIEHDR